MKLTVHVFLTLDGVMQAPGGLEEDQSGGFARGGWLVPLVDDDFGVVVEGWFGRVGEFLLGRSTYDAMFPYWSQVTDPDNPAAVALNGLPKHVVSSTLKPTWAHTTVIDGADLVAGVSALKAREAAVPGGELQVHGSHQLVGALHNAGLIDEYHLLTFPVVVGGGKRLFEADAVPSGFEVIRTQATASGAVYQQLRPIPLRTGGEFVVEDGREVTRD